MEPKTNRIYVKNVKPRDFEPCEPFEIAGRPYIDQTGNFKMVSMPGAATEPQAANRRKSANNPQIAAARALRTDGKSHAEIAKALGVVVRTVEKWESKGWLRPVEVISDADVGF